MGILLVSNILFQGYPLNVPMSIFDMSTMSHGVRHNSVRDSLAFWLEKMVADHWPRRVRETSETGVLVFHDTLDQAACVGVNFITAARFR